MKISNQEIESYYFFHIGDEPTLRIKTTENCSVIYTGKKALELFKKLNH